MFQKANRYLADWRDKKGNRRRKSFATANEAQFYEDAQKANAHPKTPRVGRQSPSLSRSSSGAKTTRQSGKLQGSLSKPAATSKSSTSTSRTLQSSMCVSRSSKAHSPGMSEPRRSSNSSTTSRSTTARTKNSQAKSRGTTSQSRATSRQQKKKGR